MKVNEIAMFVLQVKKVFMYLMIGLLDEFSAFILPNKQEIFDFKAYERYLSPRAPAFYSDFINRTMVCEVISSSSSCPLDHTYMNPLDVPWVRGGSRESGSVRAS